MFSNSFDQDGYAIVDNFLPEDIAKKIIDIFASESKNNWKLIEQIRSGHYGHVFKTSNSLLPKENEAYSATFSRSESIEHSPDFKNILNSIFKEKVSELFNGNLFEFDTRVYQLKKGDHYRVHTDSYAGQINIIYYVNQNWIWDWGGILHICSESNEEYCRPIFPKYNRAVFLNNKKFHSPHFVSQVSEFALETRFSIVIFASSI